MQATTPENLWLAFDGIEIEKSEIKNLTTIMANWVNKAGYPVVTVKLVDGGNYTFTQVSYYEKNLKSLNLMRNLMI